jgi:hypothetical protein
MRFSNEGGKEYAIRDEADKELEIELKRIKMIKKMGWFKGRMIV